MRECVSACTEALLGIRVDVTTCRRRTQVVTWEKEENEEDEEERSIPDSFTTNQPLLV